VKEIRETCNFCIRYKARMVEVEMGKIHENRLVIAPPFTYCQMDLMGPCTAFYRHNHRSTVKVWGVVFKDTASGAIFIPRHGEMRHLCIRKRENKAGCV
jgi:hypothetical protein